MQTDQGIIDTIQALPDKGLFVFFIMSALMAFREWRAWKGQKNDVNKTFAEMMMVREQEMLSRIMKLEHENRELRDEIGKLRISLAQAGINQPEE